MCRALVRRSDVILRRKKAAENNTYFFKKRIVRGLFFLFPFKIEYAKKPLAL